MVRLTQKKSIIILILSAEQILKLLNTNLFLIKCPWEKTSKILSLFKCISYVLSLKSSMLIKKIIGAVGIEVQRQSL